MGDKVHRADGPRTGRSAASPEVGNRRAAHTIEELCEAGLDEVVGIVEDKISDLRFDALHFAAGSAKLIDSNHDGIADSLASGVWTAEINAGFGLRPVPATFTATR